MPLDSIASSPAPSASADERSATYLELGRLLFKSGATSQRVVDSIRRAAEMTGDPNPPHVLVEYDAIILETGGGRIRMNQARGFSGVDVAVLTAVSRFLRGEIKAPLELAAFRAKISQIASSELHFPLPLLVVAAAGASVGFDLLNGADFLSLWALIPAAVCVFLLRRFLIENAFNLHVATLAAVTCGGLVASLCARFCGTATPQIAFIAPMLFLVPGPAMINGGVDILRNHNTMGLARVAFTFVLVSMITLGLALAMSVLPPPCDPVSKPLPLPFPGAVLFDAVLGGVAAASLAMLNNAHSRLLIAFALCGAFARALRAVAVHQGVDIVSSTLLATALSTLVSTQVARVYFAPAYIMSVVAVLSMVPGLFAINGLHGLFAIAAGPVAPELLASTAQSLLKAALISASLVAGVIIPVLFLDRSSPRI